MSVESQTGIKIDVQILSDLVRSLGFAQNRYRRINKFSQPLLCTEKDKLCFSGLISYRC